MPDESPPVREWLDAFIARSEAQRAGEDIRKEFKRLLELPCLSEQDRQILLKADLDTTIGMIAIFSTPPGQQGRIVREQTEKKRSAMQKIIETNFDRLSPEQQNSVPLDPEKSIPELYQLIHNSFESTAEHQ